MSLGVKLLSLSNRLFFFLSLSVCLAGFTNLFHQSLPSFSATHLSSLPSSLSVRESAQWKLLTLNERSSMSLLSFTPPHPSMASPHCRRSARYGCWVWVTGSWGRRYSRPWSPRPRSQTCGRWWSSHGCSTRGNLRREEKWEETLSGLFTQHILGGWLFVNCWQLGHLLSRSPVIVEEHTEHLKLRVVSFTALLSFLLHYHQINCEVGLLQWLLCALWTWDLLTRYHNSVFFNTSTIYQNLTCFI